MPGLEEILRGIFNAVTGFFKLGGFSTFQTIGTIGVIIAAIYSVMFYLGYDIKFSPRLGIVKYHQYWGSKALALGAISFALRVVLEVAGAAIVLVPGFMTLKLSFLFTGTLPALFGVPAVLGVGLGGLVSDIFTGKFNPASLGYFYWGIVSYHILYRFYGHDPSLTNLRSWVMYTLGWWVWGIGANLLWPAIIVLNGLMPLEVAWTAYAGVVFLMILAFYFIDMPFLPFFYRIVKRWGLFWRDIPGYYRYEYVFPKVSAET